MQSTGGRKRALSPPNENRDCSPPLGIEVVGRHALLFDDDSTAAFINSSNALLPWNGDPNLVLDRYDVRHLLQDLSGLRKKRVPQPNTDVTEEELDFERYRDLDNPDDPASDNEETSKRQKSTVGGYKGVPFSYGTEETSTGARKSEDGMESSDFKPPFWVPDNLLDKLAYHMDGAGLISLDARLPILGTLFPADEPLLKDCAATFREDTSDNCQNCKVCE